MTFLKAFSMGGGISYRVVKQANGHFAVQRFFRSTPAEIHSIHLTAEAAIRRLDSLKEEKGR